MIEIGEIWRRPGPCDWVKIIDVMIPGYPTYDGGAPGVSVQFSGLGKRRDWVWIQKTWFILAHNEAMFALKMMESGRERVAPGTPIGGVDPFADRGRPSTHVEVEMRRSKYGNRKVELDGEKFDSIAERDRWASLRLMERAGEIQSLRRQVRFHLSGADGTHVCDYIADSVYRRGGEVVIEDVKGVVTDVFRIKAKLMAAQGTPVTIYTKDKKCRALTNKSQKR